MIYILEDTINGILMGSIYGLTALGLTIIFGVLKVINFAHGSLLMVGMYVAYWAVMLTGLHPYLTLVLVVPVMFLFGYYLQDIVIKPIFKAEKQVREPITVIIVTTGVWYILDNLTLLVFGPQYRNIQDNPLRGRMLELGDMLVSVPKLWGFGAAILTALAVYTVFSKNPHGARHPGHQSRPGSGQSHGNQPIQGIQCGLRHRHGHCWGGRRDPDPVLQCVPHGGGALRYQRIHNRRTGRPGQHRWRHSGGHHHWPYRIRGAAVYDGHLDRGHRIRVVSDCPFRQTFRAVWRQIRLVVILKEMA